MKLTKAQRTITFDIDTRKVQKEIKRMQAQLGETYYHEDEVKQLIKAFQNKYNDAGCDGLPYNPKSIRIILKGEKVK